MKNSHGDFLRECLGEIGFDSLNKAIGRQGQDSASSLDDTYMSLMVVPRALLSWVTATLKNMKDDSTLEVDIPGGKGARLLVNKFKNDIYKGYVYKDGEIIHRFSDVTIPALSGHLMTVLELYDNFDDKYKDSKPVIDELVPLIDRMIEEKMKHSTAPITAPTINININNGKEETPTPTPTIPSLPVLKEEPKANDSFDVGYHMAMGNFHREKGEKDKAYKHDQKLDSSVKKVGKYSGINKDEFDSGAEHAVDRIKKRDDEGQENREDCGCEEEPEHNDQYDDERKQLRNDKEKEEHLDLEDDRAADDMEKDEDKPDEKKPEDFDPRRLKEGVKVEMEHTNDKDLAAEIAKDNLTKDSEHYQKLNTIEKNQKWMMSKAEIDSRCPDCGGKEFSGNQFVGCICMAAMRGSKVQVLKHESGNYELKFGRGWDSENIELLLEILKRRNNA